jgi:K+-sensing histidine kinase KdpD
VTKPTIDLRDRQAVDADVRNSLAVLVGTSALLRNRWDELPEELRLQLIDNLVRRSEELQRTLLPLLDRSTLTDP